jgi:type II secretory pathway pseudopilin PulG
MATSRLQLRRFSARHRPAAFTLIELTLVIATIAILSAVAIPRYASSLNHYRVDLATKRVIADIALARSAARASGTGLLMNFASPANGYTLVGLPAMDGRSGDYAVNLMADPYKVSLASASFGNGTSIQFTRYGTPQAGGSVVVSSGGYAKTILVDAVTGRAEVQ